MDILPLSLKRLVLYLHDPPTFKQVIELVGRQAEVVPNLASIRLVPYTLEEVDERHEDEDEVHQDDYGDDYDDEWTKELIVKCEAANIRLFLD